MCVLGGLRVGIKQEKWVENEEEVGIGGYGI